jgi:hypothetical protein
MKLIGSPLHTSSVIIFTLLFGAGIGSLSSKKLNIDLTKRWRWPFLGIFISGPLLVLVYPYISNFFLASPLFIRILISSLLIFPLGFFLGMPFPLGILTLEKYPQGAIAWAWGMNGLLTVIGGLGGIVF